VVCFCPVTARNKRDPFPLASSGDDTPPESSFDGDAANTRVFDFCDSNPVDPSIVLYPSQAYFFFFFVSGCSLLLVPPRGMLFVIVININL